ncbi:ABC transporter permease [Natronorarus salvus]|uniref:ABC transporter permease n=1 Tax=Natronorarus salvus TaxID=3117733 RepID=UPI002F269AA1
MVSLKYIAKRIVITIFLVWAIITFLFGLFRFMPGTYVDILTQGIADPELIEEIEEKYAVHEPLHEQYIAYMHNMLTGDMGDSFQYRDPVLEVVLPAMANSLILVLPATVIGYIIGSYVGTYMAKNRGSIQEKGAFSFATLCGTIPEFYTSMLLIVVFAVWFGLFPTSGMASIDVRAETDGLFELMQTANFWWHYTLPASAIVIRYIYAPSLIMRTSVIETRRKEFIYYIRMTGLAPWKQTRHLMKHASLPVITAFPSELTRVIGGMVLVEVVFNWPGIGFLLVQSILVRDFPVVQFVFFLIALSVILGNFAVDIIYSIIDPRIAIDESND